MTLKWSSKKNGFGNLVTNDGGVQSIVLGGGCFWCLEAAYQLIDGVIKVVPGYAGGTTKNPSYNDVGKQNTGHAEVVRVDFDLKIISFEDILDIFWSIHNPTTPNYQGNDVGPQYRSIILFNSAEQQKIAQRSKQSVQKLWNDPVVTEIVPLKEFYEAEPEHHNYFANHPDQAYCQVVINPKLQKLRAKFSAKLKK